MDVLKRGAALLLSLGVLCGVGSAFRKPCCPLVELARSTPSLSGDCCQDPICCDTEKKGPAPAALTNHACSARTLATMTAVPVHPVILTASLFAPVHGQQHLAFDHSPPDGSRDPQALLSVFRL
ncbi:MAG TPA: hypothetical protein VLO07_08545 [Thermoanaerobaculia bacterium]|nr:hypothetical protein [Thermoanaerobaculia bacterium]